MAQSPERAQGRLPAVLLVVLWVVIFGGMYGSTSRRTVPRAREWSRRAVGHVADHGGLRADPDLRHRIQPLPAPGHDRRSRVHGALGGVLRPGTSPARSQLCDATNKPLPDHGAASRGRTEGSTVLAAMDEGGVSELPADREAHRLPRG